MGAHRWTARRVKILRRAWGDTQEEFAQRLGVGLATVQRWEAGRASPSRMATSRLLEQQNWESSRSQRVRDAVKEEAGERQRSGREIT